jgi:hypothetical protein
VFWIEPRPGLVRSADNITLADAPFRTSDANIVLMENVMGQVILWPKPEDRPARPARNLDGPKGRVLLFLGVRYERHSDDDANSGTMSTLKPERGTRRRKRG